jgi:hypothetical protein
LSKRHAKEFLPLNQHVTRVWPKRLLKSRKKRMAYSQFLDGLVAAAEDPFVSVVLSGGISIAHQTIQKWLTAPTPDYR